MSNDTIDLKVKYPTSKYSPDLDCLYCRGTGEKKVHLNESEFIKEQDVLTPCICIFVEHKFANKIAPVLGKWAKEQIK